MIVEFTVIEMRRQAEFTESLNTETRRRGGRIYERAVVV
jgi:hypothetical protein